MPRVLIVDDTPLNLAVAVAMLKQEFECVTASSAAEALDRLKQAPLPDLALLDIMMPEMDGLTLCSELKRHPAWSRIPVIFLTALQEEGSRSRARAAGAADYLEKPVPKELLRARLRHWLNPPAQTTPSETKP